MPRSTRRSVLRGAAGLGAAGLAAGFLAGQTVTPATAAERAAAAPQDGAATLPAPDEPMVAHVHDAQTGIVDLFIGTRHVRFTDRQLAAQLARAAQA